MYERHQHGLFMVHNCIKDYTGIYYSCTYIELQTQTKLHTTIIESMHVYTVYWCAVHSLKKVLWFWTILDPASPQPAGFLHFSIFGEMGLISCTDPHGGHLECMYSCPVRKVLFSTNFVKLSLSSQPKAYYVLCNLWIFLNLETWFSTWMPWDVRERYPSYMPRLDHSACAAPWEHGHTHRSRTLAALERLHLPSWSKLHTVDVHQHIWDILRYGRVHQWCDGWSVSWCFPMPQFICALDTYAATLHDADVNKLQAR